MSSITDFARKIQDAKMASLKAVAQVPTVHESKAATRSAIQSLDLFT